jgi:transposase
MKFKEVSDKQWEFIEPLLPRKAKEGRPRTDDRQTINAILYVLKTGIPWNDLPQSYGDDVTAWRRLHNWEKLGVWKKIFDLLIKDGYSKGKISVESVAIDSSDIPAKKGGS